MIPALVNMIKAPITIDWLKAFGNFESFILVKYLFFKDTINVISNNINIYKGCVKLKIMLSFLAKSMRNASLKEILLSR
ncbi:hypothetical protein NIES4074_22960 [Cylindrospermum sp. NIES-4074]|nr:hypothetical protein NIES4074_22960 [Cylindrospermum sp. NIES-4074]